MATSNTDQSTGKINLPDIDKASEIETHVDNGQILYKLDAEDSLEELDLNSEPKKKTKIHLMEGGLAAKDEESDEVSADEFSIEDAVSGLAAIQFGQEPEKVSTTDHDLEPTVIEVETSKEQAATDSDAQRMKPSGETSEENTEQVSMDPPLFATESPIEVHSDPTTNFEFDSEQTEPIEKQETEMQTIAVATVEEVGSSVPIKLEIESQETLSLEFTGEETTDVVLNRYSETEQLVTHKKELKRLAAFCAVFGVFLLIPFTTEALEKYRVWIAGEPLPLVHLVQGDQTVSVTSDGILTVEEKSEAEPVNEDDSEEPKITRPPDDPTVSELKLMIPPLSDRKPAKSEELIVPTGSMDAYFKSLALIEDGAPHVSRALVWGDSTIANDGVIKNVRSRFQAQFGDGGPGFLAVQVDPKWSIRRDILRKPSAGWKTRTIVYGGSHSGRYGLAGTVSTAYGPARSRLGGTKVDGNRQPLNRFQIFYETQPRGGNITATLGNKVETISTTAAEYGNGFKNIVSNEGVSEMKLATSDGRVTMYGVAMETKRGSTWETFGVAGSSVRSMRNQPQNHIVKQVEARDPQLIVYWTGGNELGYPSLKSKSGKAYKKLYRTAIEKLKSGAPNASCLLISPLDQGVRERGRIVSKKTLKNIIRFQSEVAQSMGCAYWNAREAMGGEGAIKRWRHHKPTLASGDLAHLTRKGRALIGESLADALLYSYALWKLQNPLVRWKQSENVAISDSEDMTR